MRSTKVSRSGRRLIRLSVLTAVLATVAAANLTLTYLLYVTGQNRDSALALEVPDLNAWIGTGDGQVAAIRMPGHDLLGTRAGGEISDQ